MQAIVVEALGGPEVLTLREHPTPQPGPGHVLVRNHAIGVNFSDTERRRGTYGPPQFPYVPGNEAAGIVEAVGPDVDPSWRGRRVSFWAMRTSGAYAQFTAAPVGALRVTVVDEAHVRADGVLAGAGNLHWQAAHRRSQGRRSAEQLGTVGARFFRLTGSGDVWIAGAPARWMPLALMEDVLYVREDRVLAFEGSLSWEAGTVPGADVRMLQFRGRGTVALEVGETPIAIKVTDDRPTLLSSGRLVGWVGRLVPHGARPPGDGAEAPFQVVCQGEGVVLIDTALAKG